MYNLYLICNKVYFKTIKHNYYFCIHPVYCKQNKKSSCTGMSVCICAVRNLCPKSLLFSLQGYQPKKLFSSQQQMFFILFSSTDVHLMILHNKTLKYSTNIEEIHIIYMIRIYLFALQCYNSLTVQ